MKEFWERFSEASDLPLTAQAKLKLQFEELIVRGFSSLSQHGKPGSFQFLVGWPLKSLSPPNIWRLVLILESPSSAEVPYTSDLRKMKMHLLDIHSGGKLEEKLQFLDEASATYLLTALSSLVQQCDSSMMDLIEPVTMEIMRISFLSQIRSTYSRPGRDLICAICQHHPTLITEVLNIVRKNLDNIGSMAVYLFQEMPLKLWKPERCDLEYICEWLVNAKTLQEISCVLAREILSNMNWSFLENGELMVPFSYHHYVAVAIVEAFLKFISSKKRKELLYEGLLRVSNMVTTGKSTPEQQLIGWCWQVLLDLKLHRIAQYQKAVGLLRNNEFLDENVPNLVKNLVHLGPLQVNATASHAFCFRFLLHNRQFCVRNANENLVETKITRNYFK